MEDGRPIHSTKCAYQQTNMSNPSGMNQLIGNQRNHHHYYYFLKVKNGYIVILVKDSVSLAFVIATFLSPVILGLKFSRSQAQFYETSPNSHSFITLVLAGLNEKPNQLGNSPFLSPCLAFKVQTSTKQ